MEAYTKTVGVHILDLPQHLDREYSYYIPETLCFSPAVGDFAVVPFGGANKKHIALITSVGQTNDYGRLKPLLAQINRSLSLTDEMMELSNLIAAQRGQFLPVVAWNPDGSLMAFGDQGAPVLSQLK